MVTPLDAPVQGRSIHRPCLDGNAAAVFQTPHVTLRRGRKALRHLAEALNSSDE
jgi:hypothetical protein